MGYEGITLETAEGKAMPWSALQSSNTCNAFWHSCRDDAPTQSVPKRLLHLRKACRMLKDSQEELVLLLPYASSDPYRFTEKVTSAKDLYFKQQGARH